MCFYKNTWIRKIVHVCSDNHAISHRENNQTRYIEINTIISKYNKKNSTTKRKINFKK